MEYDWDVAVLHEGECVKYVWRVDAYPCVTRGDMCGNVCVLCAL